MTSPEPHSIKQTATSPFFSLLIPDDKTLTIKKFGNINPLCGHENYNTWSATMCHHWRGLNLFELVVEGLKPAKDSNAKELRSFKALSHQAISILLSVVSSEILEKNC